MCLIVVDCSTKDSTKRIVVSGVLSSSKVVKQ